MRDENAKLLDCSDITDIIGISSAGAPDCAHKKVSLTGNRPATDRSTRVDRSIELGTLPHKHQHHGIQQHVLHRIENGEQCHTEGSNLCMLQSKRHEGSEH